MTMQAVDTQLLLLINQGTANALFDLLMTKLTSHGYLLAFLFVLGLLIRGIVVKSPEKRKYLTITVWAIVIAWVSLFCAEWLEKTLKVMIARERPCRVIEGIRLIVKCPGSFSMPSGHATSSFSFSLPLFYLTRDYLALKWRLFPVILASLIAFSRLYLGVHYPTDVLAGAVLGALIGLAFSMLYEVLYAKGFLKQLMKS